MSSNVISLTPAELREQCKVYGECAGDIEDARDKVNTMNGYMAEHWKGEAFASYEEQYNELCEHVNDFCQLCRDVERQLNSYATTIEERDQEDAKSFGFGE